MRLATAYLFARYHRHIRDALVKIAPVYAGRLRRDAEGASVNAPPEVQSTLHSAGAFGATLLHATPYKGVIRTAVRDTFTAAKDQTARALKRRDVNPDTRGEEAKFFERTIDGVDNLMADSIDRAATVFDEWLELDPDRSPRAGDSDALGDMLDDGLDGIAGLALAGIAIGFGLAFAAGVKLAQQSAGVARYYWKAQQDSVVRPEHLDLDDGEPCDWDDPPLKADKSTNEEDDHPGEDYNCRCVASPIGPDEDED